MRRHLVAVLLCGYALWQVTDVMGRDGRSIAGYKWHRIAEFPSAAACVERLKALTEPPSWGDSPVDILQLRGRRADPAHGLAVVRDQYDPPNMAPNASANRGCFPVDYAPPGTH